MKVSLISFSTLFSCLLGLVLRSRRTTDIQLQSTIYSLEPGRKAYFESTAYVSCIGAAVIRPVSEIQFREVAG